jgi:hypothetical protein
MPQSLATILLHVVFSTKNRAPWIPLEIEPELHPYLASICRAHRCPSHEIGGADDHIHIVCSLARTVTVASLLEEIKSVARWAGRLPNGWPIKPRDRGNASLRFVARYREVSGVLSFVYCGS